MRSCSGCGRNRSRRRTVIHRPVDGEVDVEPQVHQFERPHAKPQARRDQVDLHNGATCSQEAQGLAGEQAPPGSRKPGYPSPHRLLAHASASTVASARPRGASPATTSTSRIAGAGLVLPTTTSRPATPICVTKRWCWWPAPSCRQPVSQIGAPPAPGPQAPPHDEIHAAKSPSVVVVVMRFRSPYLASGRRATCRWVGLPRRRHPTGRWDRYRRQYVKLDRARPGAIRLPSLPARRRLSDARPFIVNLVRAVPKA